MPTLKIADKSGSLIPQADLEVWAVMLFPGGRKTGDPKTRTTAKAFLNTKRTLNDQRGNFTIVPRDILAALCSGPGWDEIETKIGQAQDKGMLAGHMLEMMLNLHTTHPEHASINKAYWALTQRESWGAEAPSLSTVRRAWAAYKPVAHLWAVYTYSAELMDKRIEISPAGLKGFLAMAEQFRKQGECTFLSRQKAKPFLDSITNWRCPSNLSLPQIAQDFSFPTYDPSPDLLNGLKKYSFKKLNR